MRTLMFFYVGASLVLLLIALPLIARRIKPNPFYGFRVRQTLEDPEVWYATNEFFARRLALAGSLQGLVSLGLYFVPGLSLNAYALGCLAIFVLASSIAFSQSWRYMQRLR